MAEFSLGSAGASKEGMIESGLVRGGHGWWDSDSARLDRQTLTFVILLFSHFKPDKPLINIKITFARGFCFKLNVWHY